MSTLDCGCENIRSKVALESTPHRRVGCRVQVVSVKEHDRSMCVVQSLVHATAMAFGSALARTIPSPSGSYSTLPYQALMGILARLLQGQPEVYWDIQKHNPFSASMRQLLIDALLELEANVSENKPDRFKAAVAAAHSIPGIDWLEHERQLLRWRDG